MIYKFLFIYFIFNISLAYVWWTDYWETLSKLLSQHN